MLMMGMVGGLRSGRGRDQSGPEWRLSRSERDFASFAMACHLSQCFMAWIEVRAKGWCILRTVATILAPSVRLPAPRVTSRSAWTSRAAWVISNISLHGV